MGSDKLRQFLRHKFDEVDKNRNGYIEHTELQTLLQHLGMSTTRAQVIKIVEEMDSDRNGRVDFDDFVSWWSEQEAKEKREALLIAMKADILECRKYLTSMLDEVKKSVQDPTVEQRNRFKKAENYVTSLTGKYGSLNMTSAHALQHCASSGSVGHDSKARNSELEIQEVRAKMSKEISKKDAEIQQLKTELDSLRSRLVEKDQGSAHPHVASTGRSDSASDFANMFVKEGGEEEASGVANPKENIGFGDAPTEKGTDDDDDDGMSMFDDMVDEDNGLSGMNWKMVAEHTKEASNP